jgi:AGZA family xanthine/uracil permease-like MFS transporter
MLERLFGLRAEGVTAKSEIVAGVTVFFTIAYILFVNPQILSAAGMDRGSVFMATAIAAALTTALMGLYANLPVALAPGMGQNAYFAFTVVPLLAGDWRLALGCVFVSGILFVAISASPEREWLINAIPKSQKRAIGAGIGFFLALIGFEGAGWVKASSATLLQPGNLSDPKALIAAGGLLIIAALWARGITGAVLIGIAAATAASMALGLTPLPTLAAAAPPSIAPTFLQLHFTGSVGAGAIASVVLVFLLLDLLDTSGTLTAVGHQAGLMRDGRLKNGRRTGLVAVTVAVLFIAALLLAPLAGAVPAYATAPALIFVAALFARELKDVDWDDITESLPALITALAIPFTFSIASGIGIGFIAYAGIKLLAGRWREIGPGVTVIALAFTAKVVFS